MEFGLIAFLIALGGLLSLAFFARSPRAVESGTEPEALAPPKTPEDAPEEAPAEPSSDQADEPSADKPAAEKPAGPTTPPLDPEAALDKGAVAASPAAPVSPPPKTPVAPQKSAAATEIAPAPEDLQSQYRRGLERTRKGFIARLDSLIRGAPKVDQDLRDEIEAVLFTSDIGATTAQKLLDRIVETLDRKQIQDPQLVWDTLKSECKDLVDRPAPPLDYEVDPKPYVLLMVGVNGVGKTTTLAKLAAKHRDEGRKVLLVAGDTFRAAATEQLQRWAEGIEVDIHTGKAQADPAGVLFEGIQKGRNEGYDVVLCDTAGRLHTRKELMDELAKIRRSANKALSVGREQEQEIHDTFLVLDATIGQNALAQAELFKEATECSGIVVTKLDGTAKGGVVLGICDHLQIPIRFLGIGEKVEDLRPFEAESFVQALFGSKA